MLFQRFYCEPLAQAAYLIAHGDEAVVVDPPRDVAEILAFAEARGLTIRWALATHVHADFVCGLGELAVTAGARVGLGERFSGPLRCERLEDDSEIMVGDARLRVLATPGHTPESVSLLLQPPAGEKAPLRLLSGDTLFLGDVGRPDLVAGVGAGTSPRAMARALFHSLHERIAPLPDATEVWPAHGAGSACGTNISCEASSTLGVQRVGNWALGERDVERFCDRLISAQRKPPRYFAHAAEQNRRGARLLADLGAPAALALARAEAARNDGAQLLDVRARTRHAAAHWPGALHLGLDGQTFESWAGALLQPDEPVLLLADSPTEATAAWQRLLRIGIDDVVGFCAELPADAWSHPQLEAAALFTALQRDDAPQVVDVRRPAEFEQGHVPGAVHAELSTELAANPALDALDKDRPTAVICRSGYRSSAAIAQLRRAGFREPINVLDGMLAWQGNHLPEQTGTI